jgi:hypothetical protein
MGGCRLAPAPLLDHVGHPVRRGSLGADGQGESPAFGREIADHIGGGAHDRKAFHGLTGVVKLCQLLERPVSSHQQDQQGHGQQGYG